MIVNVNELERVMNYLREINKQNLEDITWVKGSEKLQVNQQDLENWLYTGLSNTSFANAMGWINTDS